MKCPFFEGSRIDNFQPIEMKPWRGTTSDIGLPVNDYRAAAAKLWKTFKNSNVSTKKVLHFLLGQKWAPYNRCRTKGIWVTEDIWGLRRGNNEIGAYIFATWNPEANKWREVVGVHNFKKIEGQVEVQEVREDIREITWKRLPPKKTTEIRR